jgi:hypothetical protein
VTDLLPSGGADGLWRSLVSALRSGRRGPRFKSGQPDHKVPGESVAADELTGDPSNFGAILARSSGFDLVTTHFPKLHLAFSPYRWP